MRIRMLVSLIMLCQWSMAQWSKENIYSAYALYDKRVKLEKELRERTIGLTFSMPVDSENEYRFESACNAISQFQFADPSIRAGLAMLLQRYDSLQYDTRRALLEAVYGVYPSQFVQEIGAISEKEANPKLFSMCAAYLYRQDTSVNNINALKIRMVEQFPDYDSVDILVALEKYLDRYQFNRHQKIPPLTDLFQFNKTAGRKVIYSFQQWDRDHPGFAIVQQADGRFVRHPDGRLMVFEQLARSASDLPYFIINGSTPQGVYSIQGIAISNNNFIGPTPNLQLLMPCEGKWENYFQLPPDTLWDSTQDASMRYAQLLPPSWRNYIPMRETFEAGKIGRTEIIAHGSTIDPAYFKDKPYYPLTPTMGCLCAKEIWNVSTGRLLVSEQLNLVSAFSATPGSKGYLYVINVGLNQDLKNIRDWKEMKGW